MSTMRPSRSSMRREKLLKIISLFEDDSGMIADVYAYLYHSEALILKKYHLSVAEIGPHYSNHHLILCKISKPEK